MVLGLVVLQSDCRTRIQFLACFGQYSDSKMSLDLAKGFDCIMASLYSLNMFWVHDCTTLLLTPKGAPAVTRMGAGFLRFNGVFFGFATCI